MLARLKADEHQQARGRLKASSIVWLAMDV
jgi:hypothetical protein